MFYLLCGRKKKQKAVAKQKKQNAEALKEEAEGEAANGNYAGAARRYVSITELMYKKKSKDYHGLCNFHKCAGQQYTLEGQPMHALKQYDLANSILRKTRSPLLIEIAEIYSLKADCYQLIGGHQEALELVEEGIKILQKSGKENQHKIIEILPTKIEALIGLKRYLKANETLKEFNQYYLDRGGHHKKHKELYLKALIEIGIGNYVEGIKLLRQYNPIVKSNPDLTLVTSYQQMGLIHLNEENFEEAKIYIQRSVDVARHLVKKERHAEVLKARFGEVSFHLALKEYQTAEQVVDECSKIVIADHGESSYLMSEIYRLQAIIFYSKNDVKMAISLMNKVLGIKTDIFGKKHHVVADVYKFMGDIYLNHDASFMSSAQSCYKSAFNAIKALYPSKDHPDLIRYMFFIAVTSPKDTNTLKNKLKDIKEYCVKCYTKHAFDTVMEFPYQLITTLLERNSATEKPIEDIQQTLNKIIVDKSISDLFMENFRNACRKAKPENRA